MVSIFSSLAGALTRRCAESWAGRPVLRRTHRHTLAKCECRVSTHSNA
ncbi:hypothetical protein [Methanosphaerula palustris]|nr:hypothetical protein [Methanosphaerula palustris]